MPAVAIIPARGGSKGIPHKNLQRVGGRSLVARAVESCFRTEGVAQVVVSSDDAAILHEAELYGATALLRPAEIASDIASSESALLHAIDGMSLATKFDVLVFVQCTAPFLDVERLGQAIAIVEDGQAESVFSAVQAWDFLWSKTDDGAVGVNHDGSERKRRQDLLPQYRETGSFYVMDMGGFVQSRHRFFGRTDFVLVDRVGAVDVDESSDLSVARALSTAFDERFSNAAPLSGARAIVWDFDGVHTDDMALIRDDGSEAVVVNRSDGMGVRLLREAGVPMLIISSETNDVVQRRAEKLQIPAISGTLSKLEHLTSWAKSSGIPLDRIVYVGNDINDLGCLNAVGFPIAVKSSPPEVISAALYVTETRGGRGAVREVATLFLNSNAI